MPCYATGSRQGDLELSLSESQKIATKSTQRLCATLEVFEQFEEFNLLPADVKRWWKSHKEVDARRKFKQRQLAKKKRLAAAAKKKLSAEERRALNLE